MGRGVASETACFFVGGVVRGEVVVVIEQLVRLRGEVGWCALWTTIGVLIRHCWKCLLCGLLLGERGWSEGGDGGIYIGTGECVVGGSDGGCGVMEEDAK